MSQPRPETLDREKEKLFLTEAELFRRLGLDRRIAKPAIDQLTAKAGFPRPQALFGNRRYWPAVREWLDRHNGLVDHTGPTARRSL